MGILKCVRVRGRAWTAGGTGLDDVAKSGAIETAIERSMRCKQLDWSEAQLRCRKSLRKSSLVLSSGLVLGQVPGRGDSESIKSEGRRGSTFLFRRAQIKL